jgi:hypothetical protein
MERKVFHGFAAVVVQASSHRKLKIVWWADAARPPDLDPSKHIDVDLDASPAGLPGNWAAVEVDDRGIDAQRKPLRAEMSLLQLSGYHVTSLGGGKADGLPRGCMAGVVYLEESRLKAAVTAGKIGAWPPASLQPYQLTTVAYSTDPTNGPRAGRRYAGFHGKLKRASGTFMLVEIPRQNAPALGPFWFDLSSADDCDYDPPWSGPRLQTSSAPGDEGALFLELQRVAAHRLENPKIPIGLGA